MVTEVYLRAWPPIYFSGATALFLQALINGGFIMKELFTCSSCFSPYFDNKENDFPMVNFRKLRY